MIIYKYMEIEKIDVNKLAEEKVLRRRRNTVLSICLMACLGTLIYFAPDIFPAQAVELEIEATEIVEYGAEQETTNYLGEEVTKNALVIEELGKLAVREWATHDGYSRSQFMTSSSWNKWNACNVREKILGRDLDEIIYDSDGCTVLSGVLNDPYTGKVLEFRHGTVTSSAVQIDHVVALSNAWATGAQVLDFLTRNALANDDLNLLAVDGPANMQKSDSDASEWLPPNKGFICEYIARQVAVKIKYSLWVRAAEMAAIRDALNDCPRQEMPVF